MFKNTFETKDPFCNELIFWYEANKRDLPWRHTSDPYKVWLSEIMLQQTKVEQGLSYYLKFIEHYPTVVELAKATEKQVLRDWQGLGYYSRARNLHATAKIISEEFSGVFPSTYADILKLKGIGSYTAAAIASFSYGLPHAVLDGNVFRVLARLFGVNDDISSGRGKKVFQELADHLLDQQSPAIYNQAIMEFGALQCVPKNPSCEKCCFKNKCVAFNEGTITELPFKSKKTKVRERWFNYLFVRVNGKVAFHERLAGDVWQGLYEMPLIELEKKADSSDLVQAIGVGVNKVKFLGEQKHILSHQKIMCLFWEVEFKQVPDTMTFYTKPEIEALPKSVLINNFLIDFYF